MYLITINGVISISWSSIKRDRRNKKSPMRMHVRSPLKKHLLELEKQRYQFVAYFKGS